MVPLGGVWSPSGAGSIPATSTYPICITNQDPSVNPFQTGRIRMSKKGQQSTHKGRDARTGHFIPVEKARQDPTHTTVERVPLPGKGKK